MPGKLPRSEFKIIIRPRGGLHTGRVNATELMAAIMTATETPKEETMQDTICPNVAQNIIVLSTPSETRAVRYAKLRALTLGDQTHEVYAYHAAPDNTTKGVIRNISAQDTPEEIRQNIVNDYNPMAIDAHRIGSSTTVIVLFQGNKVPATVKYGAVLVRCGLYRQHHEVCKTCGKIGHRQDVCPQPNVRVCFACGKSNPDENHESECKPHCKLCGGPHPTGTAGCINKFKTPYMVKRRQRIGRQAAVTPEARPSRKDDCEFPPLQQQPRGRSRSGKRGQRPASRSASRGGREKSSSRRRGNVSQSRERVTWAEVTNTPAKRQRSKTPQARPAQSTQHDDKMQSLRDEITTLKEENARLNRRLDEALRLLENPQATRSKNSPPQSVKQQQWEQGHVPLPPSLTPRHQQGAQTSSPTPTTARTSQPMPPPKKAAKLPSQNENATTTSPAETAMEEEHEEDPSLARDEDQEPRTQGGISVAVRLRRCTERIDRLEKRMDAFEHRVNARFTAMERRFDALQEFLYRKLGRDEDAPKDRSHLAQPPTTSWQLNQQQDRA